MREAGEGSIMEELQSKHEAIADLCGRWKVRALSLFGSAARGELRPDSESPKEFHIFATGETIAAVSGFRLRRNIRPKFGGCKQRQMADIHGGDQKYQYDRAKQNQQRQAHVANQSFT